MPTTRSYEQSVQELQAAGRPRLPPDESTTVRSHHTVPTLSRASAPTHLPLSGCCSCWCRRGGSIPLEVRRGSWRMQTNIMGRRIMSQVRTPGEICWGGLHHDSKLFLASHVARRHPPSFFCFFFPEMPPFVEFVLVGNRTVRCGCFFFVQFTSVRCGTMSVFLVR